MNNPYLFDAFRKIEKQMLIIESFERAFGASTTKIMVVNEGIIVSYLTTAQALESWHNG